MTHRRGNGLLAASYAPLTAVSPAHADRLLVALREAGIAAYAQEQGAEEGDLLAESGSDGVEGAPRDADRVYVDTEELESAVDVLRQAASPRDALAPDIAQNLDQPLEESSGAEGPAGVDGAEWQDLIARFYDDVSNTGSWPDAENVGGADDESAETARARAAEHTSDLGLFEDSEDGTDGESTRDTSPGQRAPDDEGHFIPPPPPPIPWGTPASRLAWIGVLGGPAVVLVMVMLLGRTVPSWLLFLVVVGFIAGVVVLVARMPDGPPRRSDPDDGAIT